MNASKCSPQIPARGESRGISDAMEAPFFECELFSAGILMAPLAQTSSFRENRSKDRMIVPSINKIIFSTNVPFSTISTFNPQQLNLRNKCAARLREQFTAQNDVANIDKLLPKTSILFFLSFHPKFLKDAACCARLTNKTNRLIHS
jgi:hypothetical protein